jgi:hypothetical protein
MDIPVSVTVIYGTPDKLVQYFREKGMQLMNSEYIGELGFGAPSIFHPMEPFITATPHGVKNLRRFFPYAVHHEMGHIKDLRYSGEENIMSHSNDDANIEAGKMLGFKKVRTSVLMPGWPDSAIFDYYERIVDYLADTMPMTDDVKKNLILHKQTDLAAIPRKVNRCRKGKDMPHHSMADYIMRVLAMDVGLHAALGTDGVHHVARQLRGYSSIVDEVEEFFKNIRRPVDAAILATELRDLEKAVGLVYAHENARSEN